MPLLPWIHPWDVANDLTPPNFVGGQPRAVYPPTVFLRTGRDWSEFPAFQPMVSEAEIHTQHMAEATLNAPEAVEQLRDMEAHRRAVAGFAGTLLSNLAQEVEPDSTEPLHLLNSDGEEVVLPAPGPSAN